MPTGVYERSEAIKANMRLKMKGNKNHLGFINTAESKIKMSLSAQGKHSEELNPLWKGDEAGYVALHYWIRRKLGKPTHCSNNINHIGRFEWANISGEYKRELSDWHELCHSCNKKDGVKKHRRFLS